MSIAASIEKQYSRERRRVAKEVLRTFSTKAYANWEAYLSKTATRVFSSHNDNGKSNTSILLESKQEQHKDKHETTTMRKKERRLYWLEGRKDSSHRIGKEESLITRRESSIRIASPQGIDWLIDNQLVKLIAATIRVEGLIRQTEK